MSNAPLTKYTDRDVRENDNLIERAYEWLEAYQGEFEYLIDMKMRAASGFELTVPMIRGVLNCMRHDPRVMDLPSPLPPVQGDVVSITSSPRNRRAKRLRASYEEQCSKSLSHSEHQWYDSEEHERHWCEGIPWEINRFSCDTQPKIKVAHVAARTGGLIHQVAAEGHYIDWKAKSHEWGWYGDPELIINLVCKYPSVLRDPHLLRPQDVEALLAVGYQPCQHCICTSENMVDLW